MLRGKVEGKWLYYLRTQVLRKAQKISRPLPLVSREAHKCGGPIFSVKSGLVPGFSGRSEYSVTPLIRQFGLKKTKYLYTTVIIIFEKPCEIRKNKVGMVGKVVTS